MRYLEKKQILAILEEYPAGLILDDLVTIGYPHASECEHRAAKISVAGHLQVLRRHGLVEHTAIINHKAIWVVKRGD